TLSISRRNLPLPQWILVRPGGVAMLRSGNTSSNFLIFRRSKACTWRAWPLVMEIQRGHIAAWNWR
ncbi:hypothetical protein DFQ27_007602, partial [Actinomortierella ambigua]